MNETTLNNNVPAPASTGGEKAAEDAPTIPVSMNYRLSLEQISNLTGDMETEAENEPGEQATRTPSDQSRQED